MVSVRQRACIGCRCHLIARTGARGSSRGLLGAGVPIGRTCPAANPLGETAHWVMKPHLDGTTLAGKESGRAWPGLDETDSWRPVGRERRRKWRSTANRCLEGSAIPRSVRAGRWPGMLTFAAIVMFMVAGFEALTA